MNYANNGQIASANMVSTFVQNHLLWTGDQGAFFIHSLHSNESMYQSPFLLSSSLRYPSLPSPKDKSVIKEQKNYKLRKINESRLN